MLLANYSVDLIECGCDEAGRGCLAGPVYAAAVILPKDYNNPLLNDSKKLNETKRHSLRNEIEKAAISFGIGVCTSKEIDDFNILNASFLAMHRAIEQLTSKAELLLIDGNRFTPYLGINHVCIIKGDEKYQSIAAASILAKTYRDDFMDFIHNDYPVYLWNKNKGYPTIAHRKVIKEKGLTDYHRKTFKS